ncbi:xanthine dehydrogenase [Bradyrhizobium xenonodulans]|uniref:Xanthine dehydrogenase n=1 Tax=Bradyrhizobium xenonodulans TaxID=2736875 RepID=A0ABY7MKS9_9BRAD|nr:xanthine dehydrogenase [Bradyrhizobium xenonodulans]WBL77982.1 xanthine dehydrogenase [Bradyrhizobium xenonodulans]
MSLETDRQDRLFVIILGTNEIASAIAVHLARGGTCVVLSHDPDPPVMRRRMAFHDALFAGTAQVEDIVGERLDDAMQVLRAIRGDASRRRRVIVSSLGLVDLLPIRRIDVLIDARLQKRQIRPDLRRLAGLTIGLGPGFSKSSNCDVAIETRPGRIGLVQRDGWTDAADGVASRLGDLGAERFVYSGLDGTWRASVAIGTHVEKDLVLGHLSGAPVMAPRDGVLRGIIRDGTEVPSGVKLLEIDPRGVLAQWTGIDDRGRAIANAALSAVLRGAAQRFGLVVQPEMSGHA